MDQAAQVIKSASSMERFLSDVLPPKILGRILEQILSNQKISSGNRFFDDVLRDVRHQLEKPSPCQRSLEADKLYMVTKITNHPRKVIWQTIIMLEIYKKDGVHI